MIWHVGIHSRETAHHRARSYLMLEVRGSRSQRLGPLGRNLFGPLQQLMSLTASNHMDRLFLCRVALQLGAVSGLIAINRAEERANQTCFPGLECGADRLRIRGSRARARHRSVGRTSPVEQALAREADVVIVLASVQPHALPRWKSGIVAKQTGFKRSGSGCTAPCADTPVRDAADPHSRQRRRVPQWTRCAARARDSGSAGIGGRGPTFSARTQMPIHTAAGVCVH